ncbi:hypothetical protein [Nitrosospira sp. NRS527]|uniref:hypothetical protein n=1 Tax=Nitrosospira sp. NRS527 TaxID=155925 RepID=UPI001AF6BA94|nr:hypothetical protein [Nitrosospira sp. NRS527]BCT66571.1 hypothetical protein NNRS527_00135 [Nitrosospira sp. NRS527]
MSNESVNYWKFATIGILLVGATVAATLLVTGRDSKTEVPDSQKAVDASPTVGVEDTTKSGTSAKLAEEVAPVEPQRSTRVAKSSRNTSGAIPPPPPAGYSPQPAYPSQSVMEACNKYANGQVASKTEEVVKNAALGAAIGAAIGAAGGAIAGGGSGAGKGAAIGGVTGVAGGSLYGLNETKSHDAQYQAAYASCMRSKGY